MVRWWLLPNQTRRRLLGVVGIAVGVWLTSLLSSLQTELHTPLPSTLVVDRHGVPLIEVPGGTDGERLGHWPLPEVLPMRLSVATRETEDRRFFEHPGVSVSSIARALGQNLSEGRVISGASTLAMQVARLQSGRARTLQAKVQEALEALILVHRYGHDDVLRQYLTLAPYGARVHGAERASRFYFDKPTTDLSWLQAAWLAGLPQQPTRLGPFVDGGLARGLERARRIVRQLYVRGYLNDDELAHELGSDLGLVDRRARPELALHFALRLADEVKAARRHTSRLIRLETTLDLEVQAIVTRIVKENLERQRVKGAGNSAAIVVHGESGEVLSWVGSADWFDTDARGAIDYLRVKRSPGSTLKPFLYALAFDPTAPRHLTAASPVADLPFDVVDPSGRSYVPGNLNRTFMGPMSARQALGNSRNIPALRVLADVVGVDRALTFFDDVGVTDVSFEPGRYGLGLALGNLHVTAEELARAYLVLRHGGRVVPLVTSDLDRPNRSAQNDDAINDAGENDPGQNDASIDEPPRVLSSGAAALVTHILADPAARRPTFPEGSALDHELAVATKTGTSQGFRDGWTVAYADRFLVVMWIGNHDWRRMNHLGGLAGTAEATREIVDVVMPRLQRHVPLSQSVPEPAGSERHEVCADSGQLADDACPHRRSELFLPTTAPTTSCTWHRRVDVDVRTGDLATPSCPPDVVRRVVVVDLPPEYARFVRQQGLTPLPARTSRLCGGGDGSPARVTLLEPHDGIRYVFDPDTAAEHATIRLRAAVEGDTVSDDLVFLVDGEAVALTQPPHEVRWSLTPGRHTIQAVLAHGAASSDPVTIVVR